MASPVFSWHLSPPKGWDSDAAPQLLGNPPGPGRAFRNGREFPYCFLKVQRRELILQVAGDTHPRIDLTQEFVRSFTHSFIHSPSIHWGTTQPWKGPQFTWSCQNTPGPGQEGSGDLWGGRRPVWGTGMPRSTMWTPGITFSFSLGPTPGPPLLDTQTLKSIEKLQAAFQESILTSQPYPQPATKAYPSGVTFYSQPVHGDRSYSDQWIHVIGVPTLRWLFKDSLMGVFWRQSLSGRTVYNTWNGRL